MMSRSRTSFGVTKGRGGFNRSLHTTLGCGAMGGKYTLDDWSAVKERLRLGDTVRGAAEACGVGRGAVFSWSRMDEPPDRMVAPMDYEVDLDRRIAQGRSARQRLSFEDRAYIAAMSSQGCGPSEIALKVGVHRTTVARELARCAEGAYDPREAHLDARRRARRPKARKLEEGRLRGHVASKLALLWSPRQISMRLREEFPDEEEMRVSHEAIYQALYVQGRGSLRQEVAVEQALRSGRKRRAPRSRLPARPRGRSWVEGCGISERPPEAADRAVPGHWEGDLVVGGDLASCLVTLVERRTRFLVARRLMAHDTKTVVDLLVEMCAEVPGAVRDGLLSTLTWDQGCELADAARFTLETGVKVYFCDPHSPWQKGTNENTNGLVRQYFPKGTRFSEVSDEDVRAMQDQLNGRPRETLGWKTPAEALQSELANANRAMTA